MSREVYINFGKHKGKLVSDCPSYYLYWLIETFENTGKHEEIVEAAIEEHNYREHYGHWN